MFFLMNYGNSQVRHTLSTCFTFLLKKIKSGSNALSSRISLDSFDMLYFGVSKFQESVLHISCIFGFILNLKHQENTNKLTLARTKDKLFCNMVFDKNSSIV